MSWISVKNISEDIISEIFGGADESKDLLVSDGVSHCYGYAEKDTETKEICFRNFGDKRDHLDGAIIMFFIIPDLKL